MKNSSAKWGKFFVSGLLTAGASLTLGLLSFGGLYAIYPSVALGLASFALATVYEGEIYNSNIKEALKKLLTPNYFKQLKANSVLNELLTQLLSQNDQQPTQFFIDYQIISSELNALTSIAHPSRAQKKHIRQLQKDLKLLQRQFAKSLFNELDLTQPYATELKELFEQLEQGQFQEKHIQENKAKQKLIRLGSYFSIITSALLSLGSVYLILETLTTLSFIHLSISSVILLSSLCGTAYGFLIYNTITDMVHNETMQNWYKELKHNITESSPAKAILLTLTSITLVGLALALTAFTAGTWWTIAKHSQNLPPFLRQIPNFVTAFFIPLFTGTATLSFTLENTKGSIDTVMGLFKSEDSHNSTPKLDNKKNIPLYQKLNPFKLLINLVETPLKMTGFILHICSIGVTTDRIPGIPAKISAAMSTVSEGFEDFHYFVHGEDHENHAGHDHSHDLPSRLIHLSLSPLYLLSSFWHYLGSQFTHTPVKFTTAWQQSFGEAHHHTHSGSSAEVSPLVAPIGWQQRKVLMCLNNEIERLNDNSPLAKTKQLAFQQLSEDIAAIDPSSQTATQQIKARLNSEDYTAVLAKHRSTLFRGNKTQSIENLEQLSNTFPLRG